MQKFPLYHSLSDELKKYFGKKVIKLAIDGSFTCPNRDGRKGYGGCTFCSSQGAGEYTSGRELSISEQMEKQTELLSSKWKDALYIAYFQNFSNTYADTKTLKEKYDEALSFPGTVGLALATRPDCLGEDVLHLLAGYHKTTYLWVELGIQTCHDRTASLLHRGYDKKEMDLGFQLLRSEGIRTVAHMILSLPGETREDFAETLHYLIDQKIWGLKIHMLNILRGTQLAASYAASPFSLADREEYISLVCDLLELLPPEVTIHRLTGDGSKKDLIAPQWIRDKRSVLNGIAKELRRRGSCQGFALR